MSLLNYALPQTLISKEKVLIRGVIGQEIKYISTPLPIIIAEKTVRGRFALSPNSSVSLLGHDLLHEFAIQMLLAPAGIKLIITGSEIVQVPQEEESAFKIPKGLEAVLRQLWSSSGDDIGLSLSAEPVINKTKGGSPPSIKRYPIADEAIPSIQKQIAVFLERGILKECRSPYNTLILLVSKCRLDKDGDPEYRFVQDLRAVNEHVISPRPVVPDPSLILTQIPVWAQYFTLLDLTGAFFSIPVAEESQSICAFTRQGKQLTRTHLPQGFTNSPTIFSQVLRNDPRDLKFSGGSVLIQYVGDLSLASRTSEDRTRDTEYLRIQLAKKGHRASLSRPQLCQQPVKYLGFILKLEMREVDPERVRAIQEIPRPVTKKQLRGFSGQAGFCRPRIPGFSEIAKPLN